MVKASQTPKHEKTLEQPQTESFCDFSRTISRFCASEQTTQREKEVKIFRASEKSYRDQEDATDPLVAPQDCEVRQSGRVLELQHSDLWLRPTDLSWHFPVLMTIREEPSKNYRSRTNEKWKAKENKAEEYKKQTMQKNDDEQSSANWQTSSWSWHQPMIWASSSWKQWSSDEMRERSGWQPSADWSSSDQTRERSEWRSSGSWQSPFPWQ